MKKLELFFGNKFHVYIFFITLLTSVGLLITSFFLPPQGEIHSSVIAAVGELIGFAALAEIVAALERGTKAKVTHNNTTIEVGEINE